jgi:competence protein ComEA
MNTNPQSLLSRRFAAAFVALCLFVTALPAFAAGGAVNVNAATVEQLQLLPRIGPAVAARIVEHREKNGAFKTAEDLMLVRGIGESTFELIKGHVVLSGATTLTEKVRSPKKAKDGAAETAPKG